jgi:hypothetical protein
MSHCSRGYLYFADPSEFALRTVGLYALGVNKPYIYVLLSCPRTLPHDVKNSPTRLFKGIYYIL